MCNSTFMPVLYTMYAYESITLHKKTKCKTKRQSARQVQDKKTKCKTEKNYRHKNSLLLICTEPIVHYVAITYKK